MVYAARRRTVVYVGRVADVQAAAAKRAACLAPYNKINVLYILRYVRFAMPYRD